MIGTELGQGGGVPSTPILPGTRFFTWTRISQFLYFSQSTRTMHLWHHRDEEGLRDHTRSALWWAVPTNVISTTSATIHTAIGSYPTCIRTSVPISKRCPLLQTPPTMYQGWDSACWLRWRWCWTTAGQSAKVILARMEKVYCRHIANSVEDALLRGQGGDAGS